MERKRISAYSHLIDLEDIYVDLSLGSIHEAIVDIDENNYRFCKLLVEQNHILATKIEMLEDRLVNMEMKINYLLDNGRG